MAVAKKADVVIVGAGPVGLSLAALLARAGIATILLEVFPDVTSDLRASTFHAPTLEMLEPLGIVPSLINLGVVVPRWQMRLHPEGERAVFDMSVLTDETPYPFRLQCEQTHLTRLLYDKIKATGGVDLRFNSTVTGVVQNSDHEAEVHYDGPNGPTVITGAFVIGCDGAHSVVRKSLGFAFEGSTYPENTILITTQFPFEDHLEELDPVSYCWGRANNFTFLRVPQHWRVALAPTIGTAIEDALAPEWIEAALQNILRRAEPYQIMGARGYSSHVRLAEHYRRGRAALAGDAAHLHSSAGGTGMNGGIHDAFCLAECLVAIFKNGAGEGQLDLYEARRRPITAAEIMPLAALNRQRRRATTFEEQRHALAQMQAICADPERMKNHLMKICMIEGVRKAAMIAG